jgi:predicted molibdopterin-dependent oxidoreductase YjgC
MFRRLDDTRAEIRLVFDGHPIAARAGDNVAAALLAGGVTRFRDTPVSGAPRAPWCMMGVCFDCLVEIDGVASRQACLVMAADGMVVRSQSGARALSGQGKA